ncbi:SDR family oxidoreductase [Vitiosangium sp. GDMCC 1.1324]|uniref:SDR family oxidoreductase n=1 Tax=Vitiosangium sp. (strain GDMCC 1.1324) TaxID=2138576 RepID=UPI000D399BC1|nr:SDR family oxidoreductase [Vitiosangium sp. GDMCC 1.1324]PTL81774.1 NAD(P)-dependent oxidoreductase [Vitiosangium sp. GDMCC 1.1324]
MSASALLVTGASGQLGRRVLELLLDRKAGPLIATTRNPESLKEFAARGVEVRRADFDDEAGLVQAFRGAGRVLLISTDALDRPGRRIAQHRAAVRAAEAAGVKHVVYTSVPNPYPGSPVAVADDHRETEAALAASRLDFTILRNNLYLELQLQPLKSAIASGQLVDARGTGATAFVTREDCARAAAAALAEPATGRRTLDVTGPAAVTSDELAAITSELVGRKVVHVSVPPDALIQGMVEHGLPRPVAALLASFDAGTQKGDFSGVTDTVQRLTGRAPQSVRDFLASHRAALTGN